METTGSLEDLHAMAVFAEVVRAGSFTGAAARTGLSKSAVSKLVARLERRLGAQLLHRTTRRVAATEAGDALYERASSLAATAAAGAVAVAGFASAPRGLLRVNAPVAFGERVLAPALPALLSRHPGLRIELVLEDRLVAVTDGWDVIVRMGPVVESSLGLRRLAPDPRIVVGSADYLARAGTPEKPDDLASHNCVRYLLSRRPDEWRFGRRGRLVTQPVQGTYATSSDAALREAVVAGIGLAQVPELIVADELASGRLVTVLDAWQAPAESELHALFPRGRTVAPKTRAFLDFLVERLRGRGGGVLGGKQ